jgi:adenine C2-methylase RlmN of 23S rRNA A2503 and tRNA A37
MTIDLLGVTSDELAALARARLPSGQGVAMQLYRAAFADGRLATADFPLSAASAAAWNEHFRVGLLEVVRVVEEPGEVAATSKAILRTRDGYEIECVRIPMRIRSGRHGGSGGSGGSSDSIGSGGRDEVHYTLCLSSQVGCKMGCTFCETGRMGLARNLSAAEIVSEVVTVGALLGWRARNLVFMGMGEALDNAEQLIQALRVLADQRGLHFSQERITVCTAGHREGLLRLAALGWKRLNLSLSLNAADDAVRDRIMPVNRRTPLAELQTVLAAYPQRRNFTLGVNYCLMPGINDGPSAAQAVARFCAPLGRVLINLIPYNPGSSPLTRAPSEEEVTAFIAALRDAGLAVRRRITKGRSIMAACGQLGNVAAARQRVRAPPALAQGAAARAPAGPPARPTSAPFTAPSSEQTTTPTPESTRP